LAWILYKIIALNFPSLPQKYFFVLQYSAGNRLELICILSSRVRLVNCLCFYFHRFKLKTTLPFVNYPLTYLSFTKEFDIQLYMMKGPRS